MKAAFPKVAAQKRSREPLSARGDNPNVNTAPAAKAQRTAITLKGGVCQPPRVIGYRRTGAHCDVKVRVEKRSFEAHSHVLASGSPFFDKLVSSGEAFKKTIDLPESFRAAAFEALLEFFYVGECSFSDALLVPVLETAHHLKADSKVKDELIARCTERLTPATCVESLRLARSLSLGPLKSAAEAMVSAHFDTVRTLPSFRSVTEEMLCGLLASDALDVRREEDAFESATSWLAAQPSQPRAERAKRVERVLSLIRFPTMARAYVVEHVLTHASLDELSDGRAAGVRLVLDTYLDAYHGPPSSKCIPRAGVTPTPPAAAFTIGAPPPAGGEAGGASRGRSKSRSPGRRKSLRGQAERGLDVRV